MNKRRVKNLLPKALVALNDPNCKIQNMASGEFTGQIKKAFRSQISAFGAAVTMGSFKAAVAFFGKKADGGEIDRTELLRAMYYVLTGKWETAAKIVQEVLLLENDAVFDAQEEFINASIALKLAFNAFDLT